jgi:5-methylcytosine-specific restriction protein A
MPMRPCAVASCRNKVEIPELYCEQHKDKSNKDYNKHVRYNSDNEKYSRFYSNTQWKRVRKAKLMSNPMCEVCASEGRMTKADMVHHIIELRTPIIGWEHRLDKDNLQSICYECHNKLEHEYSNNSKQYKL